MGRLIRPNIFAALMPGLRPLLGDGGGGGAAQAAALVHDGVGDYRKHTLGPAGAADGRRFAFAVGLTKNSDGSAMTLVDIPGTVPLLLEIQSDNTVDLVVGTAGAVSSCSTTATVLAADGPVVIIAQGYENRCFIDIKKASGFTASPADTAGVAADIDFTADWWLGADGGAANFLDADVHHFWGDLRYIGGGDAEFAQQFMDDSGNLRDLGSDGSNPLGGQIQPILCHVNPAASATTNIGSGGDADVGTVFEDGASPGALAAARTNAFDLLLAAVAWWSADHAGNTITTGAVETLADRTANGNDPTQATAGNRPALTTGGGLSWAEFDGADDVLTEASPTAALMNNFNAAGTSVHATRPDSAGGGGIGRFWDKNSANELAYVGSVLSSLSHIGNNMDHATTDMTAESSPTRVMPIGSISITDFRYDKSVGLASDLIIGVDGTDYTDGSGLSVAGPSGAASDLSANDLSVGGRVAGGRTWDGGIYEMAFWDSELSTANLARVRTHQANKYSVTLA